jgi:hypothetical protein
VRPFEYTRARDAGDAVARFRAGAMYLGGGTNLVDLMRLGLVEPDYLVDVSRFGGDRIEPSGDGLLIGAAVRNSDLAAHPVVRERDAGPQPDRRHPPGTAAVNRVEGRDKVTGQARYAYEYPADGVARAYPVQSAVARGRITRACTRRTRSTPTSPRIPRRGT